MNHTREQLIDWLDELNRQIREIESEAAVCLSKPDYASAYAGHMTRKAKLLAEAPAAFAAAFPAGGSPEETGRAMAGLREFARSAETALELGSTFYMSALLYPDDYRSGQPNNLELLIAGLA